MEGWKKLRETDWWEKRTQMRRRKANTKHKYKIHMVKIQTTRCKIKSNRLWRRREGRGGGDMRQLRYITKYCGSADEYYAEGGEGKCGKGR